MSIGSEVTANLNSVECLVTKTHIGHDTIINICTNAQRDIAWAAGDWASAAGIGVLGLLMLIALVALTGMVFSIMRDGF